jgi:signal peptidase I
MKKNIILAVVISIMFLSIIIYILGYMNIILTLNKANLPSKCYTSLQPSPVFTMIGKISPVSLNSLTKQIIIEYAFIRNVSTRQISDTGSMRPALSDFQTVITIEPLIEDIHIGDIIIFNCNNKQIVHRIIDIKDGIYLTKGDNNVADDYASFGCITQFEDIENKVVGIIY